MSTSSKSTPVTQPTDRHGGCQGRLTDYQPETALQHAALNSFPEFARHLRTSRCSVCKQLFFSSELDLGNLFRDWADGVVDALSSSIKCRDCGTPTCIACTPEPFTKSSRIGFWHSKQHISWCCVGGRLFVMWALLCGFDGYIRNSRGIGKTAKPVKSAPTPRPKPTRVKKAAKSIKSAFSGFGRGSGSALHYMPGGMGYDKHDNEMNDLDDLEAIQAFAKKKQQELQESHQSAPGFGILQSHFIPLAPMERSETTRLAAKNAQIKEDKFGQLILGLLADLLPSSRRETCFDFDPPAATLEMLVGSKILGYCTELLRNDSLDDLNKRKDLYETLFGFLVALGSHSSTREALFSARLIGPGTIDLLALSFCAAVPERKEHVPALADYLRNLSTQSSIVLKNARDNEDEFASDDGQTMLSTCRQIRDLADFIQGDTTVAGDGKGKGVAAAVVAKDLVMNNVEDEKLWPTHTYALEAKSIQLSAPGRFKRLVTEIVTLQTSLPPGIFVRYCENRPDVLKCVIIGPVGTPYENGMFEFDIFCGPNFPHEPPKVSFRGTGGGEVSINPNLYPTGKVCLSLLGTWAGEPWRPEESTLLQLFISIQAMIFCAEPWYNEPGREADYEQKYEGSFSQKYNKRLQSDTVCYAILEWIEVSPPLWKDVITYHFTQQGNAILKTVEKWVNDQVGKPNSSKKRHRPNFMSEAHTPWDADEEFMYEDGDVRTTAKRSLNDDLLPKLQTALQGFGATYKVKHVASPIEQKTPPRRHPKSGPFSLHSTSAWLFPGAYPPIYDETAHFQASSAQRGAYTPSYPSSGRGIMSMTQPLGSNPSPIEEQQSSGSLGGHLLGSVFGPPSSNTRSATRGRGSGVGADASSRGELGASCAPGNAFTGFGRGIGDVAPNSPLRNLTDHGHNGRGGSPYYEGRGGYKGGGGYGGRGGHGGGRGDDKERGGRGGRGSG